MAAILGKLPDHLYKIRSPSMEFGLIGHAVAEKMFDYYCHIHVYSPGYIAPGQAG